MRRESEIKIRENERVQRERKKKKEIGNDGGQGLGRVGAAMEIEDFDGFLGDNREVRNQLLCENQIGGGGKNELLNENQIGGGVDEIKDEKINDNGNIEIKNKEAKKSLEKAEIKEKIEADDKIEKDNLEKLENGFKVNINSLNLKKEIISSALKTNEINNFIVKNSEDFLKNENCDLKNVNINENTKTSTLDDNSNHLRTEKNPNENN